MLLFGSFRNIPSSLVNLLEHSAKEAEFWKSNAGEKELKLVLKTSEEKIALPQASDSAGIETLRAYITKPSKEEEEMIASEKEYREQEEEATRKKNAEIMRPLASLSFPLIFSPAQNTQ
jgi:hypothetical protein